MAPQKLIDDRPVHYDGAPKTVPQERNPESQCDRVDVSNTNTRVYSTTFLKNKILASGERIKRITKQLRRGLQGVRQHGIWIDGGQWDNKNRVRGIRGP